MSNNLQDLLLQEMVDKARRTSERRIEEARRAVYEFVDAPSGTLRKMTRPEPCMSTAAYVAANNLESQPDAQPQQNWCGVSVNRQVCLSPRQLFSRLA